MTDFAQSGGPLRLTESRPASARRRQLSLSAHAANSSAVNRDRACHANSSRNFAACERRQSRVQDRGGRRSARTIAGHEMPRDAGFGRSSIENRRKNRTGSRRLSLRRSSVARWAGPAAERRPQHDESGLKSTARNNFEPLGWLAAEFSESAAAFRETDTTTSPQFTSQHAARQLASAFEPPSRLSVWTENRPFRPSLFAVSDSSQTPSRPRFAASATDLQRFDAGGFTSNNDWVRTIAHSSGNV